MGRLLVIVPMDDWEVARPSPASALRHARRPFPRGGRARASRSSPTFLAGAESPALVVGAGADEPDTWVALVDLAERLGVPCLAGVVQRPRRLPSGSPALRRPSPGRSDPAARDACAARRRARGGCAGLPAVPVHPRAVRRGRDAGRDGQPGRGRGASERGRAGRARRTRARLRRARAHRPRRTPSRPGPFARPAPPAPPAAASHSAPAHVLRCTRRAAAAKRDRDRGVPLEPARADRAAAGARVARLAQPRDGWARVRAPGGDRHAAGAGPTGPSSRSSGTGRRSTRSRRSGARPTTASGALFVILSNGGYAIMDRLAEQHGGTAPWPSFEVDVAGLARAFGCPARTVAEHGELLEVLDEVVPGLARARRAAAARGRRWPGWELCPVNRTPVGGET